MSTHDELDRILPAWFEADAMAPAPTGLLDRSNAATGARRPHPGWLASLRGHRLGDGVSATDRHVASPKGSLAIALVIAVTMALLACAGFLVASNLDDPRREADVFTRTGSMKASRGDHAHIGPTFTATLLDDGRVLVIGGIAGAEAPISSAEIWDPQTGTFTPTDRLTVARGDHTATLLLDGRVLVVGGYGAVDGGTNSIPYAEVWDPVQGTFEPSGSLTANRKEHTATVLLDGRVLIAGGSDDAYGILPAAEVWDPASGESMALGPPVEGLIGRSATRLDDGRVLLVGGSAEDRAVSSAEVWVPSLGSFRPTGSLLAPRYGHTAMRMPDGRVLIIGGQDEKAFAATAEVWDPATGTFSSAGPVPGLQPGTTITMLPDGSVLLVGGASEDATGGRPIDGSGGEASRWDPISGRASPAGSPTEWRVDASATLLPDGRVLLVGGRGPEATPADCRSASSRSGLKVCAEVEPAPDTAEIWTPSDGST